MSTPPRVLILGIGNLLMGDEGVGVHAIEALSQQSLPPGVELLDGGTGGFHLLAAFRDYPRLIVIDATLDDAPPGTVRRLQPRYAHEYPRSLAAHDVGLHDLIEAAALLGPLPMVDLITVSIADLGDLTTELTPLVQEALGRVVELVRQAIDGVPGGQ